MKQFLLTLLLSYPLFAFASPVDTNQFSKTNIAFVENKGQITDQHKQPRTDIDFKLSTNGVTMFVGNGQLHYQWVAGQSEKAKGKTQKSNDKFQNTHPKTQSINNPLSFGAGSGSIETTQNMNNPLSFGEGWGEVSIYRMDVSLIGANKNATLLAEELTDYTENYYLPQCPNGATAKSYKKITYQNIYPNIDWVLYVKDGQVKYDFVVRPGGKVEDIQLQYDGATALNITEGALTAITPYGSITEAAPYTYDAATGEVVNSQYQLQGNVLRYAVADNKASTLVIDPNLAWSTYYGGTQLERYNSCAADSAGNIFLVGSTQSTTNIATTGAFQTALSGDYDAFVAKFNAAGARLWATYYGGTGEELAYGSATDIQGNIYFTGSTYSTGLATTGAHQDTLTVTAKQLAEGLLVKLNTNGIRQWATYYGGDGNDIFEDIAINDIGNVYVVGQTGNLPDSNYISDQLATTGAHQDTATINPNGISGNVILVKFNTSGIRQWATYYYASGEAIACDNSGNVYIGGSSGISGGTPNINTALAILVTTGAHQTYPISTATANLSTPVITKFNGNGVRQWATLYDGEKQDRVLGMTCDEYDNLYIVGETTSSTGIATTGAHQNSVAGGIWDGFLVKFNTNGVRQWGTYYGGSGPDKATSVASKDNQIYIMGATRSSNAIATTGAYKTNFSGFSDAYFAIFNTNGQLVYGTYFGGNKEEDNNFGGSSHLGSGVICVNKKKDIFIAGTTNSDASLATTGAYQTSFGGAQDAYLAKFEADTSVFLIHPLNDTLLCNGDTLHVNYGVTKTMRSNNNFRIQLSNASSSFSSGTTTLATINSNVGGSFAWPVPASVTTGSSYRVRVLSSAPADTSDDNGLNIHIGTYPASFTASASTPLCTSDTLYLNSGTTSSGTTFSWSGPNSFSSSAEDTIIANTTVSHSGDYIVTATHTRCTIKDTFTVLVNPSPAKPTATSNSPICGGDTLKLFATVSAPSVSYSWSGVGSFGSSVQNPVIVNAQTSQAGIYKVVVSLGSCSDSDTVAVLIDPAASANVIPSPGTNVCAGQAVTLIALLSNAGITPQLQWQRNGANISGATSASYVIPNPVDGDDYKVILTPSTTCKNTKTSNVVNLTVTPVLVPSVTIVANPSTPLDPNEPVMFAATPVNGGSNPTYQWTRNGTPIGGAIGQTWGANANALSVNDDICVIMRSDYQCPSPDSAKSNCIKVQINVGVDSINNTSNLQLFPNPNNGTFTLKDETNGNKPIQLSITNSLGQTVYQTTLQPINNLINQQIELNKELAAGVYLLQLKTEEGINTIKMNIE